MVEILGDNLKTFFTNMKYVMPNDDAECTYKGAKYEVWSVTDEMLALMCEMSEEEFDVLSNYEAISKGTWAWWRHCSGSIMDVPTTIFCINGQKLLAWEGGFNDEYYCEECDEYEIGCDECKRLRRTFLTLTEYLCHIGASQPKNVCALAIDLAKYNNITLSELFMKYEG